MSSLLDHHHLVDASVADLALVRAARAWSGRFLLADQDLDSALWARFSPTLRARLRNVWPWAVTMTPEGAWQSLLDDQTASARFDPDRVHPSWFERILEAESPAVRAVVRHLAPDLIPTRPGDAPGAPITARHDTDALGETTPGTANGEVVSWFMTLWAERLVGGPAESPNDTPILLALSRLHLRDLVRLARVLGQIKYAFAVAGGIRFERPDPATTRTTAVALVRIGFFRRMIGQADPRLIPIARADFDSISSKPRDRFAVVGLITVARLLRAAEPQRARWAVQHLPYPVARLVGTLEGKDRFEAMGLPVRAIQAWESWIFEGAWARLRSEGRLGALPSGVPQ